MKFDYTQCRPAVLVVDMQETFVAPDGPFGFKESGALIDNINALTASCREAGAPIIFSNYVLRADLSDAGLLANVQGVEHFTAASPTIGVDPRLERADTDIVTSHNRPSCFFRSDLDAILAKHGVNTVILTGVSINNAISATARDAFARDIPALVVRQCVGAAPWEEEVAVFLRILDTWTAEVVDSDAVLAMIAVAAAAGGSSDGKRGNA